MTTRKIDGRAEAPRLRGDDGAALLEFALVAILLFTLIFGIINYGFMLSFKQDMTRSASEGARAGAVAATGEAENVAILATQEAVEDNGRECSTTDGIDSDGDGLSCNVDVRVCENNANAECVYVELTYDQDGHPLIGSIPLISELPPNTLTSRSVAQVNS